MSKLFVLHLTCTEPPDNLGKEADLLIAPDHGPWFERESTWNCPERQVVFFNTRGGAYAAGGNPNLFKIDGTTGVGSVNGFDAGSAHVGTSGSGHSRETLADFKWTVTEIRNI